MKKPIAGAYQKRLIPLTEFRRYNILLSILRYQKFMHLDCMKEMIYLLKLITKMEKVLFGRLTQ